MFTYLLKLTWKLIWKVTGQHALLLPHSCIV